MMVYTYINYIDYKDYINYRTTPTLSFVLMFFCLKSELLFSSPGLFFLAHFDFLFQSANHA